MVSVSEGIGIGYISGEGGGVRVRSAVEWSAAARALASGKEAARATANSGSEGSGFRSEVVRVAA